MLRHRLALIENAHKSVRRASIGYLSMAVQGVMPFPAFTSLGMGEDGANLTQYFSFEAFPF